VLCFGVLFVPCLLESGWRVLCFLGPAAGFLAAGFVRLAAGGLEEAAWVVLEGAEAFFRVGGFFVCGMGRLLKSFGGMLFSLKASAGFKHGMQAKKQKVSAVRLVFIYFVSSLVKFSPFTLHLFCLPLLP